MSTIFAMCTSGLAILWVSDGLGDHPHHHVSALSHPYAHCSCQPGVHTVRSILSILHGL